MRNDGDLPVPAPLIARWKAQFRTLDDWNIEYLDKSGSSESEIRELPANWTTYGGGVELFGQCRLARILRCPADFDINVYTMHEVLHVVARAMRCACERANMRWAVESADPEQIRRARDRIMIAEEQFVLDVSKVLYRWLLVATLGQVALAKAREDENDLAR